jgi:hypothetical protein
MPLSGPVMELTDNMFLVWFHILTCTEDFLTRSSSDCIVSTHKLGTLQIRIAHPRRLYGLSFPFQAGGFCGTQTSIEE